MNPVLDPRLTDAIDRMPAFPRSVQQVLDLTRNINCPPKQLVGAVEKDPVLTVKILKAINSAYYNIPTKITSVHQSVVYLGINTIKNMALAFAIMGTLPRTNNAGFDIQRYLLHSLATAAVARTLCNWFADGEADPADCYVAGLLHDFGKVVFARFMPEEYRAVLALADKQNIPLHQAESTLIGTDHALVGSLLATKWQFPPALVQCIREHHLPEATPTPMLDCLRVADQISRRAHAGASGSRFAPDESPAAARFGDDFDAIVAAVGNLDEIFADAATFAQVGAAA